MAENSKIEWTDNTWNCWIGCTKVSPGCQHCYAETQDKFRSWTPDGWGKGKPRKRTSESNWQKPIKWNKEAAFFVECMSCGFRGDQRQPCKCHYKFHYSTRPRVFCASLADWLDDEVPIEWLADLLKLIHDTPNLDWLLLTKRPENWERRIDEAFDYSHGEGWQSLWTQGEAPENVWIGTTIEDQPRADQRHKALMEIPAKVHFWSAEPLLSEVVAVEPWLKYGRPSWVICGGESGPGKRPMKLEWARRLMYQCKTASVPFFMKQIDKVQPIPDDLMIREFPRI